MGEVNGNEEFLGFGVDITDVDTTFVGKEDPVALEVISMSAKSFLIRKAKRWQ